VTDIAEAPAPTKIVFGTDGWRARIAAEYTFENVRRCADGVARYVVDRGEQAKGVVIAYDRRFASEMFAAAAAEVLLAHDIPIAYASQHWLEDPIRRGRIVGIAPRRNLAMAGALSVRPAIGLPSGMSVPAPSRLSSPARPACNTMNKLAPQSRASPSSAP